MESTEEFHHSQKNVWSFTAKQHCSILLNDCSSSVQLSQGIARIHKPWDPKLIWCKLQTGCMPTLLALQVLWRLQLYKRLHKSIWHLRAPGDFDYIGRAVTKKKTFQLFFAATLFLLWSSRNVSWTTKGYATFNECGWVDNDWIKFFWVNVPFNI